MQIRPEAEAYDDAQPYEERLEWLATFEPEDFPPGVWQSILDELQRLREGTHDGSTTDYPAPDMSGRK